VLGSAKNSPTLEQSEPTETKPSTSSEVLLQPPKTEIPLGCDTENGANSGSSDRHTTAISCDDSSFSGISSTNTLANFDHCAGSPASEEFSLPDGGSDIQQSDISGGFYFVKQLASKIKVGKQDD
jgi:hypothetical protein